MEHFADLVKCSTLRASRLIRSSLAFAPRVLFNLARGVVTSWALNAQPSRLAPLLGCASRLNPLGLPGSVAGLRRGCAVYLAAVPAWFASLGRRPAW